MEANRAHEEIFVGGGADAPHGRLQDYPRGVMSGELCGPGGKEKGRTDSVAEDRQVFGITGHWSLAALDPGAWCDTLCQGGCRYVVAWAREEEKATEKRPRKRKGGEAGRVQVAPGVTVESLRRFRATFIE